MNKIS